ncbi:MAG: PTS lactose/cellobiose transporter subunit IIA [Lactovum sp.]
MDNTKLEEMSMTIIANSGEARGLAFEALKLARDDKNFEKAKEIMKQANDYAVIAHKAQTELLVAHARGEIVGVDILLIHSQDHLMNSMLAIDLIEEIIKICEK